MSIRSVSQRRLVVDDTVGEDPPASPMRQADVAQATSAYSETTVLSVREAADLLGLSLSHTYEMIRCEQIPALRMGRRIIIPLKAIMALLDSVPMPAHGHEHR